MIQIAHRILAGMQHYRNPASLFYQRLRRRPIVTVTDRATGLRFRCRQGADRMMAETFHLHVYDLPFAPIRQGDIVLDIGANHGFFSCRAAHAGATVHAFEPDPTTYGFLVENIRANGLEKSIIPHHAAVGAETGEIDMYCTSEMGGGMSTIVPEFATLSGMAVDSRQRVKVVAINDVINQLDGARVRVCKIDCEGAEFQILSALAPEARQRVDAFVIEYHACYELADLMDMLLAWDGYHFSKCTAGDLQTATIAGVRTSLIQNWAKGGS